MRGASFGDASLRRGRERTGTTQIPGLRLGDPAVDATRDFGHPALGSHGHEAIGRALQERTVVTHDDERSGPIVEEVLEDPQGVQVEIVRRLIEEEDIRAPREDQEELEPTPFSAGECPHTGEGQFAREEEPLHQFNVGERRR